MRSSFLLLSFLFVFLSLESFPQPIINGDLSDASYIQVASKLNSNAGFGPDIDVSKIVYYPDEINGQLYIGIQCKLDNSNGNGIGLMLGFDQLTGIPAGSALGGSPGGHFMGGGPNFKADFPVSYMMAFNPGSGTNCYTDAVKLVGSRTASYLGNCLQTGSSITGPSGGSDFWAQNSVSFAYDNSGSAYKGFEIKIPYTQLGVTNAGNVQLFAFVVSSSGWFSDVTVPGNVTTANPGFDADFSTLSGGPYHSSFYPLPVELNSFTASVTNDIVILNWTTSTEKNSSAFEVEKKQADVNTWQKIGSVKAANLSNSPKNYSYSDKNITAGNYNYRLKMVDNDGSFNYSSIVNVGISAPAKFELAQNFPNPFNPSTTIRYQLPVNSNITLKVFDVLGNEVITLVNEQKLAGSYEVTLNADKLTSGVYYYQLKTDNFVQTKKLALVK